MTMISNNNNNIWMIVSLFIYLSAFLCGVNNVADAVCGDDQKYVSRISNKNGNNNRVSAKARRLSNLLCEASYTCSRGGATSSSSGIDMTSIVDRFNKDGYIVLKNFFDDTTTEHNDNDDEQPQQSLISLLGEDWYNFSIQYWSRIFEVLHKKGHISQPNHVMNDEYVLGKLRKPGYKEIVHRSPGRYELSLNKNLINDNSNDDPSISVGRASLYHDIPSLRPIIDKLEPVILSILKQHPNYKEVDDKKYNLLHSMLISAPESRIQQFHFDTRHINENVHWPAHIINVFIPLINITSTQLGPTDIIPKSHIETRYLQNPNKRNQAKPLLPSIAPLMNVGDVLMFDFRILHRGLSNTDIRNINRPMLVLAFSIPSFHDTANWPGPSIFE